MDMEQLKSVLGELEKERKKPRFIYTIPDFQNPSGITMSLERRKELIRIAREREIPILEDSPYRELVFSGDILPSHWSISGGKGVIMLKTFSKMLFPGMRMGWLVGEPFLIEKIIMLKQSVDLCTPSFTQLILAEFIKRGKMKQTIQKAIECYKPKSEAMLNALDEHMPEAVKWSRPRGGMFLWLVLPDRIDTKEIFMKAIENNVAYVIGKPFHCDNSGSNTLRLNYSFPSVEQIKEGTKKLANTIKAVL
jgi:2-aminoadipate transaminase